MSHLYNSDLVKCSARGDNGYEDHINHSSSRGSWWGQVDLHTARGRLDRGEQIVEMTIGEPDAFTRRLETISHRRT